MRTISLDATDIYYFTLSYPWGATYDDGSHLTHVVTNDNVPLAVTANLHDALVRIRDYWSQIDMQEHLKTSSQPAQKQQHRPICPPLWADAICINQQDDAERSQQVKLMGSIYKQSTHLLIWLGEAFSHHEALTFEDAKLMLQSPWFTRKWIVQEAIAKFSACSIILSHALLPREKFYSLLCRHNLVPMASPLDTHFDMSQDLLFNLDKFSRKNCSDYRDHVYALLSISSDTEDLEVDYGKDVLAVYTAVAEKYIALGRADRVFYQALLRPREPSTSKGQWPSWVPDWRNERSQGGAVRHLLNFERDGVVYNNRRKRALEKNGPTVQIVRAAETGLQSSFHADLQGRSQPLDISNNGQLEIKVWLVTECHGSSGSRSCEDGMAPEACLFCEFVRRSKAAAEAAVCLLPGSPCAFWISGQSHTTISSRHYRLEGFKNYTICWFDDRPYWLQKGETANSWKFSQDSLSQDPVIITLI